MNEKETGSFYTPQKLIEYMNKFTKKWDEYIKLEWKENLIPKKISIIYPTVELTNALAYVGLYCYFGLSLITGLLAVLTSVIIVLVMIKIQNR